MHEEKKEKFGPTPSADCNHVDGDDFHQLLLTEWSTAGTFLNVPLTETASPWKPHSCIKSCKLLEGTFSELLNQ